MNLAFRTPKLNRVLRHIILVTLDALAVGLSLAIALYLRMNGDIPPRMMAGFTDALPITVLIAVATFHFIGLYSRSWRFVSLGDLALMFEAATIAILLSVLTLIFTQRIAWLPLSVPIIQWFILVVMLGGGRVARRVVRETFRRGAASRLLPAADVPHRRPTLIIGSAEQAEIVLRQLELGGAADYRAVGILDDSDDGGANLSLRVRGVPILGEVDAMELVVSKLAASGRRPECVIVADGSTKHAGPRMLSLVSLAETLGLSVARASPPTAFDANSLAQLDLQPINLADLLDRPQAALDPMIVGRVVTGRRVLVTGAGGSIGRELVRQIASFNPSELLLLDACEFNLYSVDLELQEDYPDLPRTPLLCSVRQREAIMTIFAKHRPELVFHAAALKHVPLVEANVCSGIQTNVLGTRNVADAVKRFNVRAMVQVSTDKAVNPVGLMGATKRLGELYCQALDLEGHNQNQHAAPRFLTVRFGNVLGSSGSLIPLFERQLRRHEPLTITHPDIRRYFMTIFEAVQLILQSMARALEGDLCRGRIFVLDMGEPIRIIDIAQRMIRLGGLEPNRDVPIKIIGLRPGEKLYEELFDTNELCLQSPVDGVFEAEPNPIPLAQLNRIFDLLAHMVVKGDVQRSRRLIMDVLAQQSRRPQSQPGRQETDVLLPVRAPMPRPIGPRPQAA